MIDDFGTAEFVFKAIRPLIPLTCRGALVQGVNERLRFLKYNPGGNFKPHIDGCFPRNKFEESMVTLQIYLNDVKEGGATRFFHDDKKIFEKVQLFSPFSHYFLYNEINISYLQKRWDAKPATGQIAVFRQE